MNEKYTLHKAEKYQIFGEYETYFVACECTDIGLPGETLGKANFEALKRMAEIPERIGSARMTKVLRARNFLGSRIEYLLIHPKHPNLEAIAQAVGMLEEEYPVLDDVLYSSMLWEAVSDLWENADTKERMEYCAHCRVSVFAALRDEVPSQVREYLEGIV